MHYTEGSYGNGHWRCAQLEAHARHSLGGVQLRRPPPAHVVGHVGAHGVGRWHGLPAEWAGPADVVAIGNRSVSVISHIGGIYIGRWGECKLGIIGGGSSGRNAVAEDCRLQRGIEQQPLVDLKLLLLNLERCKREQGSTQISTDSRKADCLN